MAEMQSRCIGTALAMTFKVIFLDEFFCKKRMVALSAPNCVNHYFYKRHISVMLNLNSRIEIIHKLFYFKGVRESLR